MGNVLTFNCTDEELIKAVEKNHASFFKQISQAEKGEYYEDESIIWVKSGFSSTGFNGVFYTNVLKEKLNQKITEMKDCFKLSNTGFMWWVTPFSSPSPDILSEELKKNGFKLYGKPPIMALDIKNMELNQNEPEGLFIKQVKTEAELKEWIETVFDSFNFPVTLQSQSFEYLNNALKNNHYQFYSGIKNCKVVSTSLLYCSSGVAGIYWVGTNKDFRRNGYGREMTLKCAKDAKKMGYHYAILKASELGKPVYEKIGFKEYGKMGFYYYA